VAAGIAVAILQTLQGVLGSFNPSAWVYVFIAGAFLGFTFLAQRLASLASESGARRERLEVLQESLRAWPIPALDQADPEVLGVFPGGPAGPEAQGSPSDIGERVLTALETAPVVLLTGPRGAGKSRTAFECARVAFGQAPVIVPRDGRALRDLLNVDETLAFVAGRRVLWLDGLKRFIGAVDGQMLDRLTNADVKIVATVRKRTWRALLGSESTHGESAKAIAWRAKVFELPFPGAERAAPWHLSGARPADAAAREVSRPTDAPDAGRPIYTDLLSWLLLLGSLACLAIVGLLALTGGFQRGTPPTLAERLDDAKRAGTRDGRVVKFERAVDFRGSGEPARVFVFGHPSGTPAARARSDELQVWERRRGELRRALSFQPEKVDGQLVVYQHRDVGDIDGDNADELVGGWGTSAIPGELLIPSAVDWDPSDDRYRLVPLTRGPAELSTKARGEDAAGLRGAYGSRLTLKDAARDSDGAREELPGFEAQDFTVSPSHQVLIAAYATEVVANRSHRLLEVQPHLFHRTGGEPRMTRCDLQGTRSHTVRLPTDDIVSLHLALHDHWRDVSEDRFCVPVD
jgi:hypothetical protein